MLNAEFGFDGLNISLFKEFPKASVGLEGFWLKGINEFENDTLLYAGEAQVAVDVMSLFGDTGFDISKVLLANTKVKAIVLDNGRIVAFGTPEELLETSPFYRKLMQEG